MNSVGYRRHFFDDGLVLACVAQDVQKRDEEGEQRQEQQDSEQQRSDHPRIIVHYNKRSTSCTHNDNISNNNNIVNIFSDSLASAELSEIGGYSKSELIYEKKLFAA